MEKIDKLPLVSLRARIYSNSFLCTSQV